MVIVKNVKITKEEIEKMKKRGIKINCLACQHGKIIIKEE